MTDEELIEAYDADQAFRNLQPGTRHVRKRYLRKYSIEVGFQTATEQKIVVWLGRPITAKTRSMWISTINAFYQWANHNHLFKDTPVGDGFNPVSDIGKPRLHARSPRPMAQSDLQRALDLADPRMRAWLLLGGLAGFRCMEMAGLQRDDVRESQGVMRVIGKGDKERFVPLHPDILSALLAYGMPDDGPLWEETAASISRKINKFLHVQVGTKSTAHTLRHFFGTRVYQSCRDLRLTQELLGHSSPQTTAGYAAADQSQAAGVVGSLTI